MWTRRPFLVVLGGHADVPVGGNGAKVGERSRVIVAGYHSLEHQLLQVGWRPGEPARQEADKRLRAVDQGAQSKTPVGSVWIGGEIVQVAFGPQHKLAFVPSRTMADRSNDSAAHAPDR